MLINSAFIGKQAKSEFYATNQSLLGNFSKIRTYEASFHWRMQDDRYKNKPFSVFGTYLENDQEGKYINRTRLYGMYAWHAKISSTIYFSGGLQIGGMNYSVKGSNSTGHATDLKPDANTGICFYSDKFTVSLAGYQLLNSRLQPMDEITILAPYFNSYADYTFQIGEELQYKPGMLVWIPFYNDQVYFDLNNSIILSNKFIAHIGYRQHSGFVFMAGITGLEYSGNDFNVNIAYHIPSKTNWLKINVLEFSLAYFIKK